MKKIGVTFVIAEVKSGKEGIWLEAIIDNGEETKTSVFSDKEHLIRCFADKGWWLSSNIIIREKLSFWEPDSFRLKRQEKNSVMRIMEEFHEPITMELVFQKEHTA